MEMGFNQQELISQPLGNKLSICPGQIREWCCAAGFSRRSDSCQAAE